MEKENEILEEVAQVKKEFTLEKHIQTFLLSLCTSAVIGAFVLLLNMSQRLVKMEERDNNRSEQISDLKQIMKNLQTDISDLKDRMNRMEVQQTNHYK